MSVSPATNSNNSISYPSPLRWFAIIGLVSILILVETLPLNERDVLILAIAWLALVFAIRNFQATWIAFIISLPIVTLMAGMFGQPKITGFRVFLMIFLVLFIISPKPKNFWRILPKNLAFIGLVLFFLANLLSAVVSRQIEAVFRTLTYIEPLGLFILTYYFIRRQPDNWKILIWALCVSGVCVMLLGLLEFAMQKPLIDILGIKNTFFEVNSYQAYLLEDRYGLGGRISSTLLQPVYAGLFFAVCSIIQAYYISVYHKNSKYLIFILLALGLGMVLLTGSRGPLLALGAALLTYTAFTRKKRLSIAVIIIGLIVFILIIIFLIPGFVSYLSTSFNPIARTSANVFGRMDLTSSLLEIFKTHPLFGYGPGMIQKTALAGGFGFAGLGGLENQYATILADGGLIAGAAYMIFIYGIFTLALKAYRSTSRDLRNAGTMLLVLAAYYFTVVISVTALSALGGFLVMIVAGGLAGLYDAHSQDPNILMNIVTSPINR